MRLFHCTTLVTLIFAIQSCEKNYTISNHSNHYHKDQHFKVLLEDEKVPQKIRELISVKNENIKKPIRFPLAYYLVPEQDIQLIFNNKIDQNIAEQLFMIVSGLKYYKLFVHPDLDESYSFLQSAYRFIGPDQTEFHALSLKTPKTLAVWHKRSLNSTPFILNTKIVNFKNSETAEKARNPAFKIEHPGSIGIMLKNGPVDKDFPVEGQEITAVPSYESNTR